MVINPGNLFIMTLQPPNFVSRRESSFDLIGFVAPAMIGALLSLAITGFVFGVNNNIFHLPIVLALFDEPQFAQDSFIQSLRYFSAGPWLLLRGLGRHVDPYWLFLGLDYVSRLISFTGFLACADLLGVQTRKERALFVGLLCLMTLLQIPSYAGDGGIFTNSFTHSEMGNGLTLLMLYFIARGRLIGAITLNGCVFFVNAFMAVWNMVPLIIITAFLLLHRKIRWRTVLVEGSIGIIIFCLISAPVIGNILSNPVFGMPLDFDYAAYLTGYWPFHFLFETIKWTEKIKMVLVVSLGFLSLAVPGKSARPFLLALTGYAIVYLIGIAVPHFTHSAAVLNLHLLRVSTLFHLLAVLGGLALALQWLRGKDPVAAKVFAPIVIFLLCMPRNLALMAPLVILVSSWPIVRRLIPLRLVNSRLRLDYCAAICIMAVWPSLIWENVQKNLEESAWQSEWTTLGQWARANTSPDAVFLLPVLDMKPIELNGKTASRHQDASNNHAATFEFASHRRVWVDYKRGAAVMWFPSYYKIWRSRVSEGLSLTSRDKKLAYARKNNIDFVMDGCGEGEQTPPLFKTHSLCLMAIPGISKTSTAVASAS
jgi:hypothetical protein